MRKHVLCHKRLRSACASVVVHCLDSPTPIVTIPEISRLLASFSSWAGQFESYLVHCLDSPTPVVTIPEISRLQLASVAGQASLSLTWFTA